jgi:fructan beta-fructosidase
MFINEKKGVFKILIMKKKLLLYCIIMQIAAVQLIAQTPATNNAEAYRPQIHFTPHAHWMNDPNGMVFYNGTYHLFFQHNPNSSVWGPMHWGHTTSTDLIHWKRESIAIYPDSLGTIISGSAVVDHNNTSGLGENGKPPLVAIFTHHDTIGAKSGINTFQNQSIAYSNDNGKTWGKYASNPVLKNPGITDFRDPKVMWYEPSKKWIMTLATKDKITFYSSADLKNWVRQSEFGKDAGAHGGVWECPDLFSLDADGKAVWVLIVNLNPGGPNKGSATQYFLGDFDGEKFSAYSKETKWLDYGPDEYAGITWSNTGNRKIFLGWMSNWLYANLVPTETYRNAMTLPRDLTLIHVKDDILIASKPVDELTLIQKKTRVADNIKVINKIDITKKTGPLKFPCRINLSLDKPNDFALVLSNNLNEELVMGYDKPHNQYFIDRSKSGKTSFQKDFAARHIAPRFTDSNKINMTLIIDVSSVELFADDGLTVMTAVFFPNKPYDKISVQSADNAVIKKMEIIGLKGIWGSE